jgi:hypothetical protein
MMWDPRPRRLRFARDGHHLVLSDPPRVRVVTVPMMDPVGAFDVEAVRDYAVLGDSIWVVRGEPPVLERYALDGARSSETVALAAAPAGGGRLDASPFGAPSALWSANGAVHAIRGDGRQLICDRVHDECDLAVPIDEGSRVVAVRDGVSLFAGTSRRWKVGPPGVAGARALAGEALFDGRTIALFAENESGQYLCVLGARDGHVIHRLALRGITAVRFSPDRGYAFLRGGQRTLLAIDLRFGKLVKEFQESRDVVDFAVDDSAQHLALVLRDASGREMQVYTTYREFLSAAGVAPPPDATPPAVVATEEDARERDARSRIEALAAARRARQPADEGPAPGAPPAELVVPELVALRPRPRVQSCTRPQALEILNRHLGLVGALCERAIAQGWDSGRIAFPDDGAFPFEKEVAGLLGQSISAAGGRVNAADENVQAAATELRQWMTALGEQVSPLRELMEEFDLSLLAAEILMVVSAPTLWGDLARLSGSCATIRSARCATSISSASCSAGGANAGTRSRASSTRIARFCATASSAWFPASRGRSSRCRRTAWSWSSSGCAWTRSTRCRGTSRASATGTGHSIS